MIEKEFLGVENLEVLQDSNLYHFTSDAILLAKFCVVKANEVVADFCSGSGIVGFYLYGLNKNLIKSTTFFEVQKPLFDLSMQSVKLNNLEGVFNGINGKVQDLDKSFFGKFSLIVCNPPYMEKDSGEHDKKEHLAICRREVLLNLEELVKSISNGLKYGGRTCLVHRADRLSDIICLFRKYNIEAKRLQVVSPKEKEPYLILIEGVKGGKSGLKILSEIKN